MFKKIFKMDYLFFAILIFVSIVLALSVRGYRGNPTVSELETRAWKENGPFELSPERGRYALTYSILEEKSLYFTKPLAEFASPDVGLINGKYVSIFAPLLSYVIMPGYLIGKMFNASQVGAFATISFFAILNFILLRNISIKLGASSLASTIASVLFLFGTPAFAYAVNLYQHHLSTFLMLICIYSLLRFKNFISGLVIFLAFGFAIPLDYPNVFFLLPLALYAGFRILSFENIKEKFLLKIDIIKLFTPLIVIFPIIFFLWFNSSLYDNPFQLSGTVKSANLGIKNIESEVVLENLKGVKEKESKRSALGFFNTRNLLDGFYIQILSPDRGVIYYAPVVLFGILGIIYSLKKRVKITPILVSIIGLNILLYAMWGDPWGGWAFGSRYLIPSYALLSIFVALILTYWKKKVWFLLLFMAIAIYSLTINTLGAITTSAIPPQVQVLELEKLSGTVQRYTYLRNWEFLLSGQSKSFSYQEIFYNYLTPFQFYQLLTASIVTLMSGLLIYYIFLSKEEIKNG